MTNLILAGVLGAVIAITVCWLLFGLKFVSTTETGQGGADGLSNAKALLCTHYCRRISRQLHDGISQDMSLMKLNLHLFHQDHQETHLQQMQELLEKGIVELRRISRKMQPEEIDGAGILHALEMEMQFIRKSFQVCCTIDDPEGLLQKARSGNLILYSLLEEMLLNAAIHAKATRIQVVAETLNNQHSFLVRDNGIGFDIQLTKAGSGLTYLKEQANYLGATLNINSTLGNGTCIELIV
jgi:two-component system, NarL family, sensor histidine kinase DegS